MTDLLRKQMSSRILRTITALSHEFGTADYVCGGGGNTSCKDEHTLWVKPSGTTLSDLAVETFVALDRGKLAELYSIKPPADASARETLVKEMMERAVLPQTPGRASVEAPLHDSLNARYVVHTHPFIVNGMTCSKEGQAVCSELFPSALWVDYIDPGYTLCMKDREAIGNYTTQHGSGPSLIFLKNHGVFVAADEPDEIHRLYAEVFSKLKARYELAGLAIDLTVGPEPDGATVQTAKRAIRAAMQNPDLSIAASGFFAVPAGPISPDHIVYAKSYALFGEPTPVSVSDFQKKHGYMPQVISYNNAVFGVAQDGDADRAIFVDEKGNFVFGDKSFALVAKYVVRQNKGGKVVTPVSTSSCLEEVVRAEGGEVVYTAVGSPIVARVMKKVNAVFGGEENGGLIFPEHQYCRDSAMTFAKMLELLAFEKKPLSELIDELPKYEVVKLKTRCPNDKKSQVMERLSEIVADESEVERIDRTDGVKIYTKNGWVLVRPSGTEPIFRVFAESKSKAVAEELASRYKKKVDEVVQH